MDLFGEALAHPEDGAGSDGDEADIFERRSVNTERVAALSVPQSMSFCLGHGDVERSLLDIFKTGRLPHAMIFSGQKGIGKCTFAFRFARFLLKYGNIPEPTESLFGGDEVVLPLSMDISESDPVFSRVASGGHGDLLFVDRGVDAAKGKEKSSLTIDAARKVAPFLRKTSAEGGWRVVIVDDADTMNNAAQNAILKILEEPPKRVAIILVTHRIGALIPTIRSRARVVDFKPLEEREIRDLLARQGFVFSASDNDLIMDFSGGSIGAALRFAEEEGPELFREIGELLSGYPDWNGPALHKFADSFGVGSSDRRYELCTQIMVWVFQKCARLKARGISALPSYLSGEGGCGKMFFLSEQRLIEVADRMSEHFARTNFSNLDKRETVRSAFLMINP